METSAREGKANEDRWQMRKDGSTFWANGVMEGLRSPAGDLLGYVKVLRDSTERKQIEDAQNRLNERLEELVAERTMELQARQKQVQELASRLTMAEHEERHRIAQILHDDLQQLLYSIQLKLRMLSGSADAQDQDMLLESARQAENWVGEAVRTAQRLSVELSPQVLQNEGFTAALRWLAAQMEELHGLKIRLKANEDLQLPTPVRVIVFQAIRELLFNVVKHAGVGEAVVELEGDGGLLVRVVDRGRGFDVGELKCHQGFGMMSVKHRLDLLGGSMEIDSKPGRGTTVTIRAPLVSKVATS